MRMPKWSQYLVIVLAMGLAVGAVGQAQEPPSGDDPKKAPERVDPKSRGRRSVPPRPAPRKPVRKMTEPGGERAEKVAEPDEVRPMSVPDAAPSGSPLVSIEVELSGKSWGTIIVELNREKAPLTVGNFLTYVDEGFYDGTIFHRVIAGFVIQGGAYSRASRLKTDGLHDSLHSEGKNGLRNLRGTIAMARGSLPHSATSQFFINLDDTPGLDAGAKRGDEWGYCVFGRVIEGLEIVDRIAGVKTRRNPRETGDISPSQPIRAPKIKTVRRVETESPSEDDTQEPAIDEKVMTEPPDAEEPAPEVAPEPAPAENLAPKAASAEKSTQKASPAKKPAPRAAPAKRRRPLSTPGR